MTRIAGQSAMPTLQMPDVPDSEVPRLGTKAGDRAEIKRVSEEFESLFLNLVMKSMRDTVQKSGLVSGGNAEDIYASMLDQEYTKMMAAQRNTGLADSIESFLLEAYGEKPTPPNAAGLKAYQAAALPAPPKPATMNSAATSLPSLSPLSGKTRAL